MESMRFSLEYQTTEFYKNQPEDIQECFLCLRSDKLCGYDRQQ